MMTSQKITFRCDLYDFQEAPQLTEVYFEIIRDMQHSGCRKSLGTKSRHGCHEFQSLNDRVQN